MKKILAIALTLIAAFILTGCNTTLNRYNIEKEIDIVKEVENPVSLLKELSKEKVFKNYTINFTTTDYTDICTVSVNTIISEDENTKDLVYNTVTSIEMKSEFSSDKHVDYIKDSYIYYYDNNKLVRKIYSNGIETLNLYINEANDTFTFFEYNCVQEDIVKNEEEIIKINNLKGFYDAYNNLVFDYANESVKCRAVYKDNNLIYLCVVTNENYKVEAVISYDNAKIVYPKEILEYKDENTEEPEKDK